MTPPKVDRAKLRTGFAGQPAATGSANGIAIWGLRKIFGTGASSLEALAAVDLGVRQGEFLCLVGPSGCGKTTLLRILAGLEDATEGNVAFNIETGDKPLQSMVFQEQGVFPWMTVIDNVTFGLASRGVPREERLAIGNDYLRKLGLAGFGDKYPRQLSGGMRQRVNIGRAFANDPAILLMDEPLASLDEQTKMIVQEDLLRLWEGTKKTVVFITHSLDEAVVLGDRVAVMSFRPARVKATYDINLPRPRNALELRNDPEFVALRHQVWEALRAEVLASDAKRTVAS
jgi:NitT/TauT family transport system ATP-binding protein